MKKDLDYIARLEKAIREKYGDSAIQNPNGNWTQEKEKKYLKEAQKFKKRKEKNSVTVQKEGFTLKHAPESSTDQSVCPICGSYSFNTDDDVYMLKFGCCFNCYIQHIEGREERWKSGWRPNK